MPAFTKIKPNQLDLELLVSELQIQTGEFPVPLDNFADLANIAASGDVPYFNSSNDFSLIQSTEYGRSLLSSLSTNPISNRLTAINNAYWITGHSGGGTGRLDGLITSGDSAEWPVNCIVVINTTGAMPTAYRLVNGISGTHPTYSTVRPQDYHQTLNAKYWNSISLG